jgi:hypothetical protein
LRSKSFIRLSIIFIIAYVSGFLNGAFLFGDIDILSTHQGMDIRLNSELKLNGGGSGEKQILVLPKGTYLHYFRSTAWEDVLTLRIIAYDIKEKSVIISDKKSKSIYFEILEEPDEEIDK